MKKILAAAFCLLLLLMPSVFFTAKKVHSETEKEIYLTFDDGPTDSVTPKILDILEKEQVRATFFVTGRQIKSREKIIERIVRDGHSLGIHTYSHEYSEIYATSSALLQDIEKCRKSIVRVLPDYQAKLYRFPGGSFMHPNYRKTVSDAGYCYYDWNAMTGDAEKKYTSDQLLENAVRTGAGRKHIVMLMHDGITKSPTAEALTPVIRHFKEEGYVFKTF